MIIRFRQEYMAVWLKRLSAVDLGAGMDDMYKFIYIIFENGVLTLMRTNGNSFAVINIKGFEAENNEEPLDGFLPLEQFSLLLKASNNEEMCLRIFTDEHIYIERKNYGMEYRGRLVQNHRKNFPIKEILSFISKISEIGSKEFKTIDAKTFVKAVTSVKYVPLRNVFDARKENVVINGKQCWATNAARCHMKLTKDFPEMKLIIPVDLLPIVNFIDLSGKREFKYYEGDKHYIFMVGDDYFIMDKGDLIAKEKMKEELLKELNTTDYVSFIVETAEFIRAVMIVSAIADTGYIGLTCKGDKIILSSRNKYGENSLREISAYISGDVYTKFIGWCALVESLRSVSSLAIEVRIYEKSLVIVTDEDIIILSTSESE